MGWIEGIGATEYPAQRKQTLGLKVKVQFWGDPGKYFYGTVIRDDIESPGMMFILLDDGRVVRDVECVYQPQYMWLDNTKKEFWDSECPPEYEFRYNKQDEQKSADRETKIQEDKTQDT